MAVVHARVHTLMVEARAREFSQFYDDPPVLPRFRFGRLADCCSAFAVVGESSPVRCDGGFLRFNDACDIEGVVDPPGVGADAGVDACAGVEPEACVC